MALQIFGRSKSFAVKKAERFFKERRVPYQYIDLDRIGISRGELESVVRAVGDWKKLVKEPTELQYYAPEAVITLLLDEPERLLAPIVRNGKKAAVGEDPAAWKEMAELK